MNDIANLNTINLEDYTVDFKIIQLVDQTWAYCLQIFPNEKAIDFLNNKELDRIHLFSRELYNHWEYAAETAVDIIELLGFNVSNDMHYFDVLFWQTNENDRLVKKGFTDGIEFKLIAETK